jgi:hypothetical protein
MNVGNVLFLTGFDIWNGNVWSRKCLVRAVVHTVMAESFLNIR